MQLIWHGHSTWQVQVADTTFLIDPYFDNPHTSLSPESVETPDFLLVTHGHADHVADVGAFSSECTVVGTPEITSWVADEHGAGDVIGMNIGGTLACGDAFVTMTKAVHSNSINSDYRLSAGVPGGYVISDTPPERLDEDNAISFYHAGDTALTAEMRDVIAPFLQPDAAAVPIGDHFTMGPRQAAIAVDWLNVDHAFPMHYDTFPPIEVDPQTFVQAVADTGCGADVHVLEADDPFSLHA